MSSCEELHRRALLQDQAAVLLQAEVERHKAEAKRLREEAALLEETEP